MLILTGLTGIASYHIWQMQMTVTVIEYPFESLEPAIALLQWSKVEFHYLKFEWVKPQTPVGSQVGVKSDLTVVVCLQ